MGGRGACGASDDDRCVLLPVALLVEVSIELMDCFRKSRHGY